jgi:hypothetical protein
VVVDACGGRKSRFGTEIRVSAPYKFVCIGFDTPDERRWDLDAEEAQDLSALLSAAAAALTARKSAAGS